MLFGRLNVAVSLLLKRIRQEYGLGIFSQNLEGQLTRMYDKKRKQCADIARSLLES